MRLELGFSLWVHPEEGIFMTKRVSNEWMMSVDKLGGNDVGLELAMSWKHLKSCSPYTAKYLGRVAPVCSVKDIGFGFPLFSDDARPEVVHAPTDSGFPRIASL
jgi:hypothetical protein